MFASMRSKLQGTSEVTADRSLSMISGDRGSGLSLASIRTAGSSTSSNVSVAKARRNSLVHMDDEGAASHASIASMPSDDGSEIIGSFRRPFESASSEAATSSSARQQPAAQYAIFGTVRVQVRPAMSKTAWKEMWETPQPQLELGRQLGSGSFGTVYKAVVPSTGVTVAVKKVVEESDINNRELEICRILSRGNHPNICGGQGFYITQSTASTRVLHLILEFVPESLRSVLNYLKERSMRMKCFRAKVYMFQLARGIAFMHAQDCAHRDLKPENILIDPSSHVLKIADFGSAKQLKKGAANVTYICSRYYRAPELILDRNLYGTPIDLWSYGCILAEICRGTPIFVGSDSVTQLVEIIRLLGSITEEDVNSMPASEDRSITNFNFPTRQPKPWRSILVNRLPSGQKVMTSMGDEYENLLSSVLRWKPTERATPVEILTHPFFDEIRAESELPPAQRSMQFPHGLFSFTDWELKTMRDHIPSIVGKSYEPEVK